MNTYVWIIVVIVAVIILWLIATFNGLITRKRRVDEAWSDIDVQLKRRYDLIPNLMGAVKGYLQHEQGVLEKVTQARAAAMGAHTPAEHGKAENMLTSALKSLFAVSENYPELKASQNFLQLQDELSDTENKIQAARRFYNGNVRDYTIAIEQFPTNLIAKSFGFKGREFFEITDGAEREVPKVAF